MAEDDDRGRVVLRYEICLEGTPVTWRLVRTRRQAVYVDNHIDVGEPSVDVLAESGQLNPMLEALYSEIRQQLPQDWIDPDPQRRGSYVDPALAEDIRYLTAIAHHYLERDLARTAVDTNLANTEYLELKRIQDRRQMRAGYMDLRTTTPTYDPLPASPDRSGPFYRAPNLGEPERSRAP